MTEHRPSPMGISLPFRIHNGRVAMAHDRDKIRENLVHLLFTRQGERPMRRSYGSALRDLVHEPDDATLDIALRDTIARAILEHAPEVRLESVDVTREQNRVLVDIRYSTALGYDNLSLPLTRP